MSHPVVRVRLPKWHLQWMRRWVGPMYLNPIYRHVHLDVGIAPLVKALWAHRIPTFSSCQGGPLPGLQRGGRAYVDLAAGHAVPVVEVAHHHGIRMAYVTSYESTDRIGCEPSDVEDLATAIRGARSADLRPLSASANDLRLYKALERVGAL